MAVSCRVRDGAPAPRYVGTTAALGNQLLPHSLKRESARTPIIGRKYCFERMESEGRSCLLGL